MQWQVLKRRDTTVINEQPLEILALKVRHFEIIRVGYASIVLFFFFFFGGGGGGGAELVDLLILGNHGMV